jgi:hypothetical protein
LLAGGQGLRSLKAGPLEVEQVVREHRLAFQQVQCVPVKTSPLANNHAFGPALRHVDVGRDRHRLKAGDRPAFIGFDEESDFIAEAAWLSRRFGDRRFSFRTTSQTTQAVAARAGYGVD